MRTRFRPRGQAITEFALVLPVMIVILLYSMYFVELVRAKLKLQEASRYVAWEMTSYTLDDYGKAQHNKAFDTAKEASVLDAEDKYKDLESIDNRSPGDFIVGYANVKTKITSLDAPAITQNVGPIPGNAFIDQLLGVLNGGASTVHNFFGFNTKGKVQVEVSMQLDNRILPRHFLDENGGFFKADVWGGRNLQNLTLKNKFTLLASGWALPDGADAEQHTEGPGGCARPWPNHNRRARGLWSRCTTPPTPPAITAPTSRCGSSGGRFSPRPTSRWSWPGMTTTTSAPPLRTG